MKKEGLLVVCRHGESEWNLLGKWTGWTDVGLTEKGYSDTVRLGRLLKDFSFDEAYISTLKRTHQTLDALLEGRALSKELKTTQAAELNERDYGDFTGKDKWQVKKEVGEAEFNNIRRNWDHPVPGGETLKMVYARVIPYFRSEILPKLQNGENILLVAHGNSIRSLIKYLDQISDSDIADVEMSFGKMLVYRFVANNGLPVGRDEIEIEVSKSNA